MRDPHPIQQYLCPSNRFVWSRHFSLVQVDVALAFDKARPIGLADGCAYICSPLEAVMPHRTCTLLTRQRRPSRGPSKPPAIATTASHRTMRPSPQEDRTSATNIVVYLVKIRCAQSLQIIPGKRQTNVCCCNHGRRMMQGICLVLLDHRTNNGFGGIPSSSGDMLDNKATALVATCCY